MFREVWALLQLQLLLPGGHLRECRSNGADDSQDMFPDPKAQGTNALVHWKNSNVQAARRGDTKIPTSACRLSPRATLD